MFAEVNALQTRRLTQSESVYLCDLALVSFGVAEDHRPHQKLQLTILYRFALYSAASGQPKREKLHLVVKTK